MISAATLNELYWGKRMSMTAIGRLCGTDAEGVRQWMIRLGVKRRSRAEAARMRATEWTPERVAMLPDLWNSTKTLVEVKKILGISYKPDSIRLQAQTNSRLSSQPREQLSMLLAALRAGEFDLAALDRIFHAYRVDTHTNKG